MNILIPVTNTTIKEEETETVDARELHTFLCSRQDFSTWIKKRIEEYDFVIDHDFVRIHYKMEGNNATRIDYHLSLGMAKEISMVERNDKGRQARRYFIECEQLAKAQTLTLPENFADACRQLADKHDHLQFAIRTKAEIGNRREATAMNTASQAVKKANRLEVELDRSKEYSSIKRMEIITGEKFNWRLLKATSQALDKPIIKVPDQNYVEINAYHYLVWLEAYNLDIV